MRLHQELELNQVWLTDVRMEPGEEHPKVMLLCRTELTRDVADAFGCLELIYAGSVPRSGVDSMRLEGEERNCEIEIANDGEIKLRVTAELVSGFSALMEGTGPKLKFKIHLSGYEVVAAELIRQAKKDPVSLVLRPAQMALPLQPGTNTEEPADETEPASDETEPASGETVAAVAETPQAEPDFMQELIQ